MVFPEKNVIDYLESEQFPVRRYERIRGWHMITVGRVEDGEVVHYEGLGKTFENAATRVFVSTVLKTKTIRYLPPH